MQTPIRHETESDIAAIEALILAAFDNHPHHAPGQGVTEHRIVAALRAAGALSLSLVAERDGAMVGHLAFSPIRIEGAGAAAGWFVLAPVSVSPACQRQGIGASLIEAALPMMRERGAAGAVVLGDPAYYTRFGFHHAHRLSVPDVPAEYFMAQSFQGEAAAIPAGVVHFHPAFD
ncbi:GNAT family N-acetyltransferase [Burkholderia gladioli]|uniref:GNAT family N-acetyltransferase n=1 Tax=Burkholderia gladioli TaxID=28095 RepID=UPI0016413EAF|nr:N-acetyltransferase [Burkholderia gladioli]